MVIDYKEWEKRFIVILIRLVRIVYYIVFVRELKVYNIFIRDICNSVFFFNSNSNLSFIKY